MSMNPPYLKSPHRHLLEDSQAMNCCFLFHNYWLELLQMIVSPNKNKKAVGEELSV